MPRTIVVPIARPEQDPDRLSLTAIPTARSLAERTGASVVFVTAVELLPVFMPTTRSLAVPSVAMEGSMVAASLADLSGLAERIPNNPVATVARVGNPIDVVLAALAEADDPILVVASHARQGVRRVFRGSIAFRLVHEAPCPVVVVNGSTADDAPGLQPDFGTVLVPLDRSPFAEHALERALAALGRPAVRVHLVHVVEPLAYPASARDTVLQLVRPGAEDYLRGLADRLVSRGYRVTVEVRSGRAAEQICQAETEQGADLIAMATHGLSGVSRRLLGSTAEHLLAESSVPLLLVRPDEKALAVERTRSTAVDEHRADALLESPPELWDSRADAVMTAPAIVAGEETPLVDLVSTMLAEGIGSVPIVDGDGHLVGIVTEADFVGGDHYVPLAAYQVPQCFKVHLTEEDLDGVYAAGRDLTASQIMSHPVVTTTEDEPVAAIVAKMLDRNIKRLPVVRRGVPVGIVSRHDLLKLLVPSRPGGASVTKPDRATGVG
jgi:nucleotide-binding universal stress UspA family protein/predicted transcriptional regulator